MRVIAFLFLALSISAGDTPLPSLSTTAVNGDVLHANTLEIAGITFRDVTCKPAFSASTLHFLDIEAKAYRGRVTGSYSIELGVDPHVHHCHFELSGVDLQVLARSLGATSNNLAGQVDGWIDMELRAGNNATISGRGQLDIQKGSLVEFPFMVSLLAGNPGAERGHDELHARFDLRERAIHLVSLTLESPRVDLRATGQIGLDGMLSLKLSPRLPFTGFKSIPVIGDLLASGLSKLTDKVTKPSLRGHITQPVLNFF